MDIPAMIDMIQSCGEVCTVPEIRVWCHPHATGKDGQDDYSVFDTFAEALAFIKATPEAEPTPLIAYNGYEINIFALMPPPPTDEKVDDGDINAEAKTILEGIGMEVFGVGGGSNEYK